MKTITSADGTPIAFDVLGAGPPVILAAGAFNTRATTEPLAGALQDRFTVLNCDRRGRGDSGETLPYAVEREIEDVHAVIAAAGRSAALFGYSSGATLALTAAAHGLAVTKLVLYDPPFLVDDSRPPLPADLPDQLAALIADDRRGDAVELFQKLVIGIPDEIVAQMRHAPFPRLDADTGDYRRREPAAGAERGPGSGEWSTPRPARHARRAESRHCTRRDGGRDGRIPRRLDPPASSSDQGACTSKVTRGAIDVFGSVTRRDDNRL
jgi:hypothetical protein